MSKYPLLSNEIDVNNINFSSINYTNNKKYCYITYGENNHTLYLQSPTFKFIQPISKKNTDKIHVEQSYNELYLFLTPQDSSTFEFIQLMEQLEAKGESIIKQYENNISIMQIIKSCEIDNDDQESIYHNNYNEKTNIKQIIKYLKVKLLDITQIEYNKELINIDDLNELLNDVNLKMIFEISMSWITGTKMGIYLKPIKLKAIDIPKITNVNFRDEDSPSDILHIGQIEIEQTENLKQFINSQSLLSLGDSAFTTTKTKTKRNNNKNNKNLMTETNDVLNTFIPSNGVNSNLNIQKQLKDELNVMEQKKKNSSKKKSNKSNNYEVQSIYNNYSEKQEHKQEHNQEHKQEHNDSQINLNSISVSSEDIEFENNNSSTSSIEIKEYSRRKNIKSKKNQQIKESPKKKGRPKKIDILNSSNDEKTDSIIKLKELLNSDEENNIKLNIDSDSDSLNFESNII
jgi:hypothetical protein